MQKSMTTAPGQTFVVSETSTSLYNNASPFFCKEATNITNCFISLLLKLWYGDQWWWPHQGACENCTIQALAQIYFVSAFQQILDLCEHESLRSIALQDLRREDIHKQIKLSYVQLLRHTQNNCLLYALGKKTTTPQKMSVTQKKIWES